MQIFPKEYPGNPCRIPSPFLLLSGDSFAGRNRSRLQPLAVLPVDRHPHAALQRFQFHAAAAPAMRCRTVSAGFAWRASPVIGDAPANPTVSRKSPAVHGDYEGREVR